MKKNTLYLMTAFLLLTFVPIQANTIKKDHLSPVVLTATIEANEAKAKTLVLRLDEINAMDKSKLKSSDKKDLRKEVRSIKSQLNYLENGGVYLSVGALILILILLVVLL
jgi:hypothetical protein